MNGCRIYRRWASVLAVAMLGSLAGAAEPLTTQEQNKWMDFNERPLQTFTNVDLDDYLQLRTKLRASGVKLPQLGDAVAYYANKGILTPFRLNACRFDLAEGDCITFVERTLSLALASDWRSYRLISDRLRAKDGSTDYKQRNFGTLEDWIPNNAWLLEDVTSQFPHTASFQYAVRPKVFEESPAAPGSEVLKITFKGHDWKSKDKQIKDGLYVPRDQLAESLTYFRSGDVVILLMDSSAGMSGTDHMGIISVEGEPANVYMVHCAPKKVRHDLITDYLGWFRDKKGVVVLRPQANSAEIVSTWLKGQTAKVVPGASDEDNRIDRLRSSRAARLEN